MPIRIQRKRTKGWKMPDNTVYVGRGSKWGNPFVNPKVALECYRKMITSLVNWKDHAKHGYSASFFNEKGKLVTLYPEDLEKLRGKNLACWCPISKPCHADILLELANG